MVQFFNSPDNALSERKSRILRIIVDGYVSTASPVASGVVAKSGLGLSAATIRNEMGELEEEGFILRPHISAGGVPSDKGYRHFVQLLDPTVQPSSADLELVDAGLEDASASVDRWADTVSSTLSMLLSTLAFATPPRSEAARIKGVELVRLQELLLMLVVILQEASVYRQLIRIEQTVSDAEIETLRNRVSHALVDQPLHATADVPAPAGALEQQVMASAIEVLHRHEAQAVADRRVQGLSRLLGQPELSNRPGQAHSIVTFVEDSALFARVTSDAASEDAPVVLIGQENSSETLREFTLVMRRYGSRTDAQGVIGLVAPTRMEYARAIPIVRHTASMLDALIERVYGG